MRVDKSLAAHLADTSNVADACVPGTLSLLQPFAATDEPGYASLEWGLLQFHRGFVVSDPW